MKLHKNLKVNNKIKNQYNQQYTNFFLDEKQIKNIFIIINNIAINRKKYNFVEYILFN